MTRAFGERVRRVRRERGLSLRALAGLARVSAPYLSQIETADDAPPPLESTIRRMAHALEQDPAELMELAARVPEYVLQPGVITFLERARERGLSGEDLLNLLNT